MQANISVNRAAVLTLWAAVVAERLGFGRDEALTLGRAVAGLNAQAKGRRLGIYKPRQDADRKKKPPEQFLVEVCGRAVPALDTPEGVRASTRGKPLDPRGVQRYLEGKFGDRLPQVRAKMEALARAFEPAELGECAYSLYEAFRPGIPSGKAGWGARGELDLGKIAALAPARRRRPRRAAAR